MRRAGSCRFPGAVMMENWRDFFRRYRLASDRWRAGLSAEFPDDCFPPARPWMPARASPG
jgi:hypothetical protein